MTLSATSSETTSQSSASSSEVDKLEAETPAKKTHDQNPPLSGTDSDFETKRNPFIAEASDNESEKEEKAKEKAQQEEQEEDRWWMNISSNEDANEGNK